MGFGMSSSSQYGAYTGSGAKKIAWAVAKIAATGSAEFQMPDDYRVNTQDSFERRNRKIEDLRRQWADALKQPPDWSWLCSTCITKLGKALIGAVVNVWWHDAREGHRCTVDAFDQASGCHRVLYASGVTEFVNLSIQPIAFARIGGVSLD
jgi:hypothetical protein